jgi:hypothetical protein
MNRTPRYYRIRHNVRIGASMVLVAGVAVASAATAYGILLVFITALTGLAGVVGLG